MLHTCIVFAVVCLSLFDNNFYLVNYFDSIGPTSYCRLVDRHLEWRPIFQPFSYYVNPYNAELFERNEIFQIEVTHGD